MAPSSSSGSVRLDPLPQSHLRNEVGSGVSEIGVSRTSSLGMGVSKAKPGIVLVPAFD